jgi:hypothetical protein
MQCPPGYVWKTGRMYARSSFCWLLPPSCFVLVGAALKKTWLLGRQQLGVLKARHPKLIPDTSDSFLWLALRRF